jgi:hypothetical protein
MIDAPVMNDASGAHRYTTSSATSAGSISRLIAVGEHDLLDHLVLGDTVGFRLRRDLVLYQRSPHVRGVDAVGGDAVGGALHRDHLRQPLQAVLRGDVGGSTWTGISSPSGKRATATNRTCARLPAVQCLIRTVRPASTRIPTDTLILTSDDPAAAGPADWAWLGADTSYVLPDSAD